VGHNADLREREVSVNAEEAGTGRMYGAGRGTKLGRAGWFGVAGERGSVSVSALV